MQALPHTLSFITTYRCSAACSDCCFECNPRRKEVIPERRLLELIDEAADLGIVLVVFTGGECFLLRKTLVRAITKARDRGLLTRCVTNGYWATSPRAAEARLRELVSAGLNEINFSTGPSHAAHVPPERITHGVRASLALGLVPPVIAVELSRTQAFDIDGLLSAPDLRDARESGRLLVRRSVWLDGARDGDYPGVPRNSRCRPEGVSGCETILTTLAVTPDLSLAACCGLTLKDAPELLLGSVRNCSLSSALRAAPDDLLKIWLHVDGPERILRTLYSRRTIGRMLPSAVHPCQSCIALLRKPGALARARAACSHEADRLISLYRAAVVSGEISRTLRKSVIPLGRRCGTFAFAKA